MPELENQRYERFAREYIKDGNGKRSAIAAGYAPKSAEITGSKLLRNAKVKARLAELRGEIAQRLELDVDAIARRWLSIAEADPNDLVSLRVWACRYCHGKDHAYQWRTRREFNEAVAVAVARKKPLPDDHGGFGYSTKIAPHPDCPECDGAGIGRVVLKDTTALGPAARHLYAGVKETQHGIEVKMHDQAAALANLAKHLGMFRDADAAEEVDRFAQALAEIRKRGSAAPLAAQDIEDEEIEP